MVELKLYKYTNQKQYGFHFTRATANVLLAITEFLYQALDKNDEAQAVALVISMVFDRVWHAGLLYKLQSYGIIGQIFGFIQSFLTNWEMKVVLNRLASFHTNAGVP